MCTNCYSMPDDVWLIHKSSHTLIDTSLHTVQTVSTIDHD